MKFGGLCAALLMMAGFTAGAAPSVKIDSAKQRYPWNGIVDVDCTVSGIAGTGTNYTFACVATNKSTGAALTVSAVTAGLKAAGGPASRPLDDVLVSNGVYRLSWNTQTDLGAVSIDAVRFNVLLNAVEVKLIDGHEGVQLWEGGPYWATTNVGAEKPEDYGYYFWWGDTVGYKRNASNDGWVSVKDGTWFAFATDTATYGMTNAELVSMGYSDDMSTGVLNTEHDAAAQHWGGNWRMPTMAEFEDLINNTTTTWTTWNGVYGRLVTGKGAHATKSIFLPVAGYGDGCSLCIVGLWGSAWSSTPSSDSLYGAYHLYFASYSFGSTDYWRDIGRYSGQSVRPVSGFTK